MPHLTSLNPARVVAAGGLAGALLLGALVVPAATFAKGGNPAVRATGTCTIDSTSKLKAKHDNGRIEVEFEVDQNRNNRLWKITSRRTTGIGSSPARARTVGSQRLVHRPAPGREPVGHGHHRRARDQRHDGRGLPGDSTSDRSCRVRGRVRLLGASSSLRTKSRPRLPGME